MYGAAAHACTVLLHGVCTVLLHMHARLPGSFHDRQMKRYDYVGDLLEFVEDLHISENRKVGEESVRIEWAIRCSSPLQPLAPHS